MKKLLLLYVITMITVGNMDAQTKKSNEDKLKEFDGLYKVENTDIIFYTVIDGLNSPKDELFVTALSYFAINYNSANDVIQLNDKDAGLIIAKGIFQIESGIVNTFCDHTIRIDVKEGRARIILTVSQYKYSNSNDIVNIVDTKPIAEKSKYFTKPYVSRFISLCETVKFTFDNIEQLLKKQGETINEDW
jgi:hypothetical protein